MLKNYKHIIWDWNGTLLDDTVLCMDLMNLFLRQQNKKSINLETYKNIFTFPVFQYYLNAGLEITEKEFKELSIVFIDHYETFKYQCSLFTDVKSTIEKLNSENVKQSVLSAYSQDSLDEFLDYYKLLDHFENVSGLDNIYAAGKIETGKKLIENLDEEKSEIVMIGDTLHDFEVSKELGINCILVARGHQSKEVLEKSGADIIDNFSELFK